MKAINPFSCVFTTGIVLLAHMAPSYSHACSGVFHADFTKPSEMAPRANATVRDTSNIVARVIQGFAGAFNAFQARTVTGPLLEQAIVASRNDAFTRSYPIPPHIRRQLQGYATEESMNHVRYTIGHGSPFNLARIVDMGDFADAVTLVDVVVFRDSSAAANLSAWAHELTHIDQFREWGVGSFSVRYARNWREVEDPAYRQGDGFDDWRQSQRDRAQKRSSSASKSAEMGPDSRSAGRC